MLVYHRTHHSTTILRDGFRDGDKMFITEEGDALDQRGIFVSAEWPLDENEGADGDGVIELAIPESLFTEYELVEEGLTYREAMIPADALNAHLATARILSDDEVDDLTQARFDRP